MANDFYFSAFFYFGGIFAESSGFPIFVIDFQPAGEGADIRNGGAILPTYWDSKLCSLSCFGLMFKSGRRNKMKRMESMVKIGMRTL